MSYNFDFKTKDCFYEWNEKGVKEPFGESMWILKFEFCLLPLFLPDGGYVMTSQLNCKWLRKPK